MSKRFPVISLLVGLTLLMACGGGATSPTTAPPPTSAPGEESPQSTAQADESPGESGRSRDFAIAQGALRGKTDAIWKSRLQNGNCCPPIHRSG